MPICSVRPVMKIWLVFVIVRMRRSVVIYNMFSRQIAGYRALLGDGSAEVLRLVSRDLDQQGAGLAMPRRKPSLSAAE